MKKKFFNGILLVAALFVTSSAFVSCKDNDADEMANVKIEIQKSLNAQIADLQTKIDNLQSQINDLRASIPAGCSCPDWTGTINDLKSRISALETLSNTITNLTNKDEDLQVQINNLKNIVDAFQPGITKEEVQAMIDAIQTGATEEQVKNLIQNAINAMKEDLETKIVALSQTIVNMQNAILLQVTSLNIDAINNPVFGFVSAPTDVQSNILIACYGKAASDVEFPVGSGNYIADAGDILTIPEANAGKLYVTINPSSVDFTGKMLTLESTSGNQAPVILSPATASDTELHFGWTRGGNAFYEISAQIPVENLKDAAINLTKQDLNDFKEDIKAYIKSQSTNNFTSLVQDIYNIYVKNIFTAYRLKASWEYGGETYSTFSESKIAAMAVKPLSYSFNPEGAVSIEELEKIENDISEQYIEVGDCDCLDKSVKKFWNNFNKFVENVLNNVNYALQPCLLIQEGTQMSRAAKSFSYSGDILLVPTSRSAEIFAPAYKKFVKVTCDGKEVEGELLGKLINGNVLAIPLKVESGKKYDIEYQAVDFTGVTRVKNYTIYGK
jgi:chaperonin cofactor prefoldin